MELLIKSGEIALRLNKTTRRRPARHSGHVGRFSPREDPSLTARAHVVFLLAGNFHAVQVAPVVPHPLAGHGIGEAEARRRQVIPGAACTKPETIIGATSANAAMMDLRLRWVIWTSAFAKTPARPPVRRNSFVSRGFKQAHSRALL